MSRAIRRCALALTLALLAGTASAPIARAAGDDTRSAQARAELDALRDKIAAVRKQIAADKSQQSELSAALDTAEAQIDAASQRLDRLDDSIADSQRRVASLTERRDAERADLTDQLDELRDQVRSAYANGRMSKMRLLLSGENPEKLGRMLVYYEYFAQAQSRQIAQLRDALSDLAVRQRALEQQQHTLAAQRDQRAATLARLQSNQQQRRETMAALDKRLSSRQASLEEMRQDETRLENLVGTLQKKLATLPPPSSDGASFASLKGRMTPPVSGPVLARFGSPKGGGALQWQGEWLGAAEGAPVHAVAAGRVVYVGYMHRYGLIVILDHGHNYYTLYGHAESTYVEVGDSVTRGQTIAQAGRSGGHRRAGTYFEIRRGRTPINPAGWLSG